MSYSDATIWLLIVMLGIATYLIRFSFLGLMGDRQMPHWLLRHLRYAPVAVLPALVAPLVLWPQATGGETDPVRMATAIVTVAVGWWRKSMIWGAAAGAVTLAALTAIS